MIHGYGSKADQVWINVDQRGSSAFSMPPSACPPWRMRPTHVACVMAHASWLMRSASWLMRHGSCVRRHGSCVRRHGSCVRRHGSCVPLTWHASWLMRHGSCVRRHGSCVRRVRRVRRHGSCVRRHGSCVRRVRRVRRQTPRPSFSRPIQPPPVVGHDDNRNGGIFPMLLPLDLRPLSCTAWGNRVVLPTPYSSMGAIVRIKTGRGAQRSAAACCHSTKKAGIMPALFLTVRIPSR